MNPCPLCEARLPARAVVAHLLEAHREDVEADGSLKPATLDRLVHERMSDEDRERAKRRELLGEKAEAMRQARSTALTADETDDADRDTEFTLHETVEAQRETEPLQEETEMAKAEKSRGETLACGKCGKAFRYRAFLEKHEAKCKGKGSTAAPKTFTDSAGTKVAADNDKVLIDINLPAALASDVPNLTIAAGALRDQATKLRIKAEKYEAMAAELEA